MFHFSKNFNENHPLSVYLPSVRWTIISIFRKVHYSVGVTARSVRQWTGLGQSNRFFDTQEKSSSLCLRGKSFRRPTVELYKLWRNLSGASEISRMFLFSKTRRLRHCRAFDGWLQGASKRHQIISRASVIGAFSSAIKKQAIPPEEIPEAPFF